MRIRTHIASWLLLATIIPLTGLAFAAIYYIERDYEQRVREEINTSLNTIGTNLKRHMELQRELALGLANANVIQEFLPSMRAAEQGKFDSKYNIYHSRINHYFAGFQTIINGLYVMRLIDRQGNTYIKVSDTRRSAPIYESVNGLAYAEQELDDKLFAKLLRKLPTGEVSGLVLPHNAQQSESMATLSQYDYVVPLYLQRRFVGALALTMFGEDIDRVMDHAPRLYEAQLFIMENNPDIQYRNGMILYDDAHEIQMNQVRREVQTVPMLYGKAVFTALGSKPYGVIDNKATGENIFFTEIFPYEGQLVNWVLAARIKSEYISKPFQNARWVVLGIALLALLLTLLLASIGAHTLAKPVRELATQLLSYAHGEQAVRVKTDAGIDEIRDLEQAFNTMADSLDRTAKERDKAQHMMLQNAKLASIGQLAAGIGHEINNPLNNILSYAKLIERELPQATEHLQQDLASLKDEAQRASGIIQGILNFARQVPPHYAPFSVLAWLQDTISLVKQSAKTAGITLAYECVTDFAAEGDRGQLQQALINLLINAIQASKAHDQILVRVEADNNDIHIAVIDQGQGIRTELIDNVFDPFFTTKAEGEGSGLGLSISLGIIERHGGQLTIMNNLDKGVTVTITLPRKIHHD